MSHKKIMTSSLALLMGATSVMAAPMSTPEIKALKYKYDVGAAESKVMDNQFVFCDACPKRATFLAPYVEPKIEPVVMPLPEPLPEIGIFPPVVAKEVDASAATTTKMESCQLATILFKLNSSKLSKKGRAEIKEAAARIKKEGIEGVQVKGYTCRIGGKIVNAQLSERRAKVVAEELVKHGVDVDIVIGYGKKNYVSTIHLELNRRSVIAGEACATIKK